MSYFGNGKDEKLGKSLTLAIYNCPVDAVSLGGL